MKKQEQSSPLGSVVRAEKPMKAAVSPSQPPESRQRALDDQNSRVWPARKRLSTYLLTVVTTFALFAVSSSASSPDRILVVANEDSGDSLAIAEYYLEEQAIPRSNLCLLKTTTSDSIDRESFEREIFRPVAHFLSVNLLQDQILYIVVIEGIPLVVQGDPGPVGDLASVDSELALLYRYLVYGAYAYFGRIENPYFTYDSFRGPFRPFNRTDFDIYLVTRLMGASVGDVKKLVDHSVNGGFETGSYFLDLRSHRGSIQAGWLEETAGLLEGQGYSITSDKTDPVQLLGWAGWKGQTNDPSQLKWAPGALAVLMNEDPGFSSTVSGQKATNSKEIATQLIESGSSGTGWFVTNPTTDGNFRPNILFPSYLAGYNLAESFYRSLRYLSWRQVVVGDPLLSPFEDKAAVTREKVEAGDIASIDSYTGLPSHFAQRRSLFLTSRYSSSEQAVRDLLRAERFNQLEQWTEALRSVDLSLQEDSTIPAAHLLKAELLEREEHFEEAFQHYQQAAQLGGVSKDLYYKLVELALSEPKMVETSEPYARWLYVRFGSQEQRAVEFWAEVQWKLGRLKEAAATYHRLLEDEPESLVYLAALGEIYYRLENWEAAQVYLERAVGSDEIGKSKVEGVGEFEIRDSKFEIDPDSASTPSPKPQAAGRKPLEAMLADIKQRLQQDETEARVDIANRPPEIVPARVVHRTPVEYPKGAKNSRTEGEVLLKLLIDEEGRLLKSEALMGEKALAKAAIKAVQDWEFEPRKVRGRPEASLLTVRINFKLERP